MDWVLILLIVFLILCMNTVLSCCKTHLTILFLCEMRGICHRQFSRISVCVCVCLVCVGANTGCVQDVFRLNTQSSKCWALLLSNILKGGEGKVWLTSIFFIPPFVSAHPLGVILVLFFPFTEKFLESSKKD